MDTIQMGAEVEPVAGGKTCAPAVFCFVAVC